MDKVKGFLNSLFDVSFSEFITPRIIKIVYILAIIGSGIYAIALIAMAFARSTGAGIAVLLIGAPLAFILLVIYARIVLELIMIIFRISENIARLAGVEQVKPLEQSPTYISPPPAEPPASTIPPTPPTGA